MNRGLFIPDIGLPDGKNISNIEIDDKGSVYINYCDGRTEMYESAVVQFFNYDSFISVDCPSCACRIHIDPYLMIHSDEKSVE